MGVPRKRNVSDLNYEFKYSMNCPEVVDTRAHLPYLRQVARGNVLEIGVDVGNTTTALLLGVQENGGKLYSVDIRRECNDVYYGHPLWTFIDRAKDADIVTKIFPPKFFNVVYIDGDHSYEGVKKDITDVISLLEDGGLLLMHDVLALTPPNAFPGVRQAFDEIDVPAKNKWIREGSHGLGVAIING